MTSLHTRTAAGIALMLLAGITINACDEAGSPTALERDVAASDSQQRAAEQTASIQPGGEPVGKTNPAFVVGSNNCKGEKVSICHVPPGNPGNVHEICIAESAWPSHVEHGDFAPLVFWPDGDGDGFGAGDPSSGCAIPDGFVDNGRDCDDEDAGVNPDAEEVCDGVDNDCDDQIDEGGICGECTVDADCDNGLFCDGAESCNAGTCEAGTTVNCDDGVGCTVDSCNESTDSCDNNPDDAQCDNGLFCDGAETCNPVLDCQAGTDPCPGQSCDEVSDVCGTPIPPTATANAEPSNGPVPLLVSLTCAGSDADGLIVLYEWDFEGDGTYDFSSPTSGNTSHTYTSEGEFAAECRVTDNDGLTGRSNTANTLVRTGPAGSPSVLAGASPAAGVAPLGVNFSGAATDDGTIVLWEWDFEGDGTYDFASPTSPATTFTYTASGVFAPALRVTDDAGLTAVDNVEIQVRAPGSVRSWDRSFAPTGSATSRGLKR